MSALRKFRKVREIIPAALLAVATLLLLIPLASLSAGVKGNETKGKFYFKQNCKTCHVKGAKGGEITPMSKTQAQWQDYFAKGKHMKGTEPLSKYMTDEQLKDALTFVYNHAVDSPQPETCGK
jgi:mono/diheme cytochrome c family protein